MATFKIRADSDNDTVFRRACRAAKSGGRAIEVTLEESGIKVATCFPDGHIDATWDGSRYVSIVPSTRSNRSTRP